MDIKKAIGLDGDTKKLDSRPPVNSKVVSSSAIEAVVENNPQELRRLRSFFAASKRIPSDLKPEAQMVLQSLLSCFEQQKSVQEGKLADLVWGFEQVGMPGPLTVMGLKYLGTAGYIKFQAPDNLFVEITKENIAHLSVRYTPKLLDMVYEDSAS